METEPHKARRPKNRRELILNAAARLFRERGYAAVGVDDIGHAVGITGTAVYRHFESKQELLVATLRQAIAEFMTWAQLQDTSCDPATQLQDMVTTWVSTTTMHWDYAAVLNREVTALSPQRRTEIRLEMEPVAHVMLQVLVKFQPDPSGPEYLLRWLIFRGFMNGVLRYGEWAHRHHYQTSLIQMGMRAYSLPTPIEVVRRAPQLLSTDKQQRASTRERLLSSAIDQFADHGYTAVGIEDLGQGIGITGPGIYRHFEHKEAILREAVSRFDGAVNTMLAAILSLDTSPALALDELLKGLVELIYSSPALASVYFTQAHLLEAKDEKPLASRRLLLFDEWEFLLKRARPHIGKWPMTTAVFALLGALTEVASNEDLRQFDYRTFLLYILANIQRLPELGLD